MPIVIGSNIASLRAQRQLNNSSSELSTVFERLSSGLRINRASDDAAGLAISASLNSDRRVFAQGIRNFNDGISLLNIADSAIEQLSGIVVRLKELSSQAANGVLGKPQRESINNEAQALSSEYLRIVKSTEFNNLKILNGNSGDIRLQGGYGINGGITSNIGGAIGTGEFYSGPITVLSVVDLTSAIAFGDVNGDGIQDAAIAGQVGTNGHIQILIGNSDGTFSVKLAENTLGGDTKDIQLADVNGDGINDLIYTDQAKLPVTTPWVNVRIGNGDGTFKTAVTYSTEESGTEQVELVDLNNDGFLDLFTLGNNFAGTGASLRLGSANGSFGAAVSLAVGNIANDVKFADMNNDGILDIITTGESEFNILSGLGGGSFSSAVSYQLIGDGFSQSLAISDINGDGNLDLLIGYFDIDDTAASEVVFGNGSGTFSSSATYLMGDFPLPISFADLNGDGNLDMIHGGVDQSFNTVSNVRLGNGKGEFGEIITSITDVLAFYNEFELRDMNGDGVLDIAGIGGNGPTDFIEIRLAKTQSGVSALLSFDLKTRAGALEAIPLFDQKLQQLSSQRGSIGAFQARLATGVSNLRSATENYATAVSRITDADVAQESSQLVRLNILQNAAISILAQANQQPSLAVKLLSSNSKPKQ